MIGEKKSVYHSTLVKHGPAYVTVKSEAKDGKYGPFVVVEHDGAEQFLNLENENCKDAMTGLNGQDVTIEASGTKSSAAIKVTGGAQAVTKKEGKAVAKVAIETTADQMAQVVQVALTTAEGIKVWAAKKLKVKMSEEQFQAITSTLTIYLKDQGYVGTMPVRSGAEIEASDGAAD